ncbi:16S rRNA (guanine(527)-N(7))-methyltransferase RsmG [Dinoroseobacter sp. S375]|uniref:16S rRNA (guanine(527)-N(7))-methyltransferase RsmG n=1 Tax=Dinoroseobacter sp. S375 TaxID=3415136 RepID=UPI003C7D3FD9
MVLQDVSRETRERLQIYEALTKKWTKRINLIAPSTVPELWERHIVDSAQLYEFIPHCVESLVDFGSGAGFPAMVLGILASEQRPEFTVTCIESDSRKAVFLRTVAREVGANVRVLNDRVEAIEPLEADLVTARAFAALPSLLDASERHRKPEGVSLFPKGKSYEKELAAAQKMWDFDFKAHASQTEPGTFILEVGAFARV